MADQVHIVIPARLASSRLPRKALIDLGGVPVIQHVWRRACKAGAASVTVATDSQEIADACAAFGADVQMTAGTHQSGTDRIAEVADARGWRDQLIVNVQGDEPFMPVVAIRQVITLLEDNPSADLATLATPIDDDAQWRDPNCVKVVTDAAGFALLFSRAPIPFVRQPSGYEAMRHIGIYGYRADSLRRMVAAPPCVLEQTESLEQLRALWIGQRILVGRAKQTPPPGIDTQADLDAARRRLESSDRGPGGAV